MIVAGAQEKGYDRLQDYYLKEPDVLPANQI